MKSLKQRVIASLNTITDTYTPRKSQLDSRQSELDTRKQTRSSRTPSANPSAFNSSMRVSIRESAQLDDVFSQSYNSVLEINILESRLKNRISRCEPLQRS